MDVSKTYISQPQVVFAQDEQSRIYVAEVSGYIGSKLVNLLATFTIVSVNKHVRLEDVRVFGFDGSIKLFTETPAGETIGECLIYIVSKL